MTHEQANEVARAMERAAERMRAFAEHENPGWSFHQVRAVTHAADKVRGQANWVRVHRRTPE